MLKRSFLASLAAGVLPLGLPARAAEDSLELDVATASVVGDGIGRRALELRLTGASQRAFGAFTQAHVGNTTEVLIDGAVVAAPVIREPILAGALTITGAPDTDWAPIAAKLRQGGKITVRLAK